MKKNVTKLEPPVYVISGGEILTIPFGHSETIQRPDPDGKFFPKTVMLSAKCKMCGSINVLWSDEVSQTETRERQMGAETTYEAKCENRCPTCNAEISLEVEVSKYADGWKFDNYNEESCKITEVKGFVDALEEFAKWSRDANRKADSSNEDD